MSIFCLTVVLGQKKALILTLGDRVVASKDIYILISRPVNVTLGGKRHCADTVHLRTLRWGDYSDYLGDVNLEK